MSPTSDAEKRRRAPAAVPGDCSADAEHPILASLNPAQRAAVVHDDRPLLIVAGAGTGKTKTLVHRVAWHLAQGIDPSRILLLCFTRRAASEMLRRADALVRSLPGRNLPSTASVSLRIWGGTFHAIATRLLRRYGQAIGLAPDFTIHDQTDSQDLMHLVRTELGLAKTDKRFPQKATCLAIYSRCVNARESLDDVLACHFPWCQSWRLELARLFDAYVDRKEKAGVLDYDDLLTHWLALLENPAAGARIRGLFDRILVDEYQDTNRLQAEILYALSPEGKGLTVVGDDAQAIYSFRGATVENILEFPQHYPNAAVIALEQNYRSSEPILRAANAVMAEAPRGYTKTLWSGRTSGQKPTLVNCEDEGAQADFVARTILEHRESGIALRQQAVLFRASHHSILLEAELQRREIPFHKYGGLKFIEMAHVKDLLAFLRLAENPRDMVAGLRVLGLLPGIGPAWARRLMDALEGLDDFSAWMTIKVPQAAAEHWPRFVVLMRHLRTTSEPVATQVDRVRAFYAPLLEAAYDNAASRALDLEQIVQLGAQYPDRRALLAELALDPPNATQDLAGPPQRDDDYLVLSTIHSAKGLEWDVVYVIHASDGAIPSDMATDSAEQIEEERRLFYVALTRAKQRLYVSYPLRYHTGAERTTLAKRSRFLSSSVVKCFSQTTAPSLGSVADQAPIDETRNRRSIMEQTRRYWR